MEQKKFKFLILIIILYALFILAIDIWGYTIIPNNCDINSKSIKASRISLFISSAMFVFLAVYIHCEINCERPDNKNKEYRENILRISIGGFAIIQIIFALQRLKISEDCQGKSYQYFHRWLKGTIISSSLILIFIIFEWIYSSETFQKIREKNENDKIEREAQEKVRKSAIFERKRTMKEHRDTMHQKRKELNRRREQLVQNQLNEELLAEQQAEKDKFDQDYKNFLRDHPELGDMKNVRFQDDRAVPVGPVRPLRNIRQHNDDEKYNNDNWRVPKNVPKRRSPQVDRNQFDEYNDAFWEPSPEENVPKRPKRLSL